MIVIRSRETIIRTDRRAVRYDRLASLLEYVGSNILSIAGIWAMAYRSAATDQRAEAVVLRTTGNMDGGISG